MITPIAFMGKIIYSKNNSDEKVIGQLFGHLPVRHSYCVDIGAGDGVTISNSNFLWMSGWRGLAVEADEAEFAHLAKRYMSTPGVQLARHRVTPASVVPLLQSYGVPKDFDFLTLDIDSYDYQVLRALLQEYRPTLISTEINDLFPPPVKFYVEYREDFPLEKSGYFYGYSLAVLEQLCNEYSYDLVWLEYNNAYIVPRQILATIKDPHMHKRTAAEAYTEGFEARENRPNVLPWSIEFDQVRKLPPKEFVAWTERHFAAHKGTYYCSAE